MEVLQEVDPLTEFFDSIQNAMTRDRYEKRLALFFKWLKLEGTLKQQAREFASLAKKDNSWCTQTINEYMRYQRARSERKEISESTVPNFYKPIKLFCIQNDIILNWEKIQKRIPQGRKYANDRAPTREEIQFLVRYKDPRIKPIVLSMVSGGFRVGAWDGLRVKHLEPVMKKGVLVAGKLTIYEGDREEYTTFITLEAYEALQAWLNSRKEGGEKVTKDSWLMRDLWDSEKYQGMTIARRGLINSPRQLSATGVRRLIERAWVAQGVRGKLADGKRRFEFETVHGFRKYFNTVCDRHMRTLFVEFLMGHNTGIKESYNRAKEAEMVEEYLQAAPYLTILEPTPEATSSDVDALRSEVAELKEKLTMQNAGDLQAEKDLGISMTELAELVQQLREKKLKQANADYDKARREQP